MAEKLYIGGKFVGYGIMYQCGFCDKKFKKMSECAKHIEEKSTVGIAWPADIKVVPKRRARPVGKNGRGD